MSEIGFGGPPPPPPSRNVSRVRLYYDLARQCKERPGEWGFMTYATFTDYASQRRASGGVSGLVNIARSGGLRAFKPVDEWEFAWTRKDDKALFYARYIGEE